MLLFFGSFDPITNGHLNVIVEAANTFPDEKIWIVPCTDEYPHKKFMFDFSQRLLMCRDAVQDLVESEQLKSNNIGVSSIEDSRPWKTTYWWMNKLKEEDSSCRMLCGSDKLDEFRELWKLEDVIKIIDEFGIVCTCRNSDTEPICRKKFEELGVNMERVTVLYSDQPHTKVSSTDARRIITDLRKNIEDLHCVLPWWTAHEMCEDYLNKMSED